MSVEDHEELSPLHRLMTRVKLRREHEEAKAARTFSPNVRSEAEMMAAAFRIAEGEIRKAITEVAHAQVERALAKRKA